MYNVNGYMNCLVIKCVLFSAGGVLGLDNPDFISTTLDKIGGPESSKGSTWNGRQRSRSHSRLRMRIKPSRGPTPTTLSVSPTVGRMAMSSSLSVKNLRRMLAGMRDLQNAGR